MQESQCLFKQEGDAVVEKFTRLQELIDELNDEVLDKACNEAIHSVFALLAAISATSEMHSSLLQAQRKK